MSTTPAFVPLGSAGLAARAQQGSADLDPRLTRSNYFDGRLLTADDLTRDQLYLDRRLREFGRVIGPGVLRGLAATLDSGTGVVRVGPGLGVTGAGRVLELTAEITADLGDRAAIAGQNGGSYSRLPRGLYALVLQYAEQGNGRAEVFPRDLAAPRTGDYAVMVEGMTLGLAPLTGVSPLGRRLAVRAEVMAREARGDLPTATLPEDGLPLGVLAIADDRPQWLDPELLRTPARALPDPDDLQHDLSRRWEALLADVLAERRAGGLGGDFPAAEYFPLLPPAGSAPKDAFDPVQGRQGFFPEGFDVWVAPIREGDLALTLRESMPLPPLPLDRPEAGVDIIVLAPLGDADYGQFARALESVPANTDPPPLARLDPLMLRLRPLPARHRLDLDQGTWAAIWARVPEGGLRWVRRPTRTAETAVSGIVLARGSSLPPPDQPAPDQPPPRDADPIIRPPGRPDPGDTPIRPGEPVTPPGRPALPIDAPTPVPERIIDENALLLTRLDWPRLERLRPPLSPQARAALAELRRAFDQDADVVLAVTELLLLIERRHDDLSWPTLLAVANRDGLRALLEALAGLVTDMDAAAAMAAALPRFDVDPALRERWTERARNQP
ncbi:hypothetical protein [uncultured Thiohalocapsa sp.]|uniref:hypothetical protein n=1 Tax=uncultured Thiohalocapsa sp. TaxID=768990 RepID=UPI0025EEEBC4|nr:hypothetical protein [uncultured Thiohalocapsa sp.]